MFDYARNLGALLKIQGIPIYFVSVLKLFVQLSRLHHFQVQTYFDLFINWNALWYF